MKLPVEPDQRLRLFSEIIRNMPLAVVGRDPQDEFRTVIWNHAAEDLLGIPADEAMGKNVSELFPAEHAELIMASDKRTMDSGEIVSIPEEQACSRRFKDLWFHTVKMPMYDDEGRGTLLVCLFDNISEQKRSKDALKAAHAQLEGLFESVPDILIRIDRHGTFLSVKCDDQDLLLEPRDAIPGTQLDWADLTDEVVRKTHHALQRVMDGEGVQSYQYSHDVPKGFRTFDCRMAKSGADEAIIFIRDITGLEAKSKTQKLISEAAVDCMAPVYAIRNEAAKLREHLADSAAIERLDKMDQLALELLNKMKSKMGE